jgi:hypothetical protein
LESLEAIMYPLVGDITEVSFAGIALDLDPVGRFKLSKS